MKKFIIIIMLTSILALKGMDETVYNPDTPCYLALLPIEILNAIAYYVSIESDEELVARTQTALKKPNPDDYKTLFPTFFEKESHAILSAFSCNGKHIALLTLLYGDNILPELLIVNMEKKEMVPTEKLSPLSYQHIAVSNCGTLLATIDEQRTWKTSYDHVNDSYAERTSILSIQNLTNKEVQRHTLNDLFWIVESSPDFSFDFNKEKNKIIIHANCYEKTTGTEPVVSHNRHHIIIPITVNTPTTEPIKKTFNHFCKQKKSVQKFTPIHKFLMLFQ